MPKLKRSAENTTDQDCDQMSVSSSDGSDTSSVRQSRVTRSSIKQEPGTSKMDSQLESKNQNLKAVNHMLMEIQLIRNQETA